MVNTFNDFFLGIYNVSVIFTDRSIDIKYVVLDSFYEDVKIFQKEIVLSLCEVKKINLFFSLDNKNVLF